MVSFGLFGSSAPRIRKLQPQQVDMLGYAPQLMAQPTEQRRPRFTAQDAQMSNEPAPNPGPSPGPSSVANTPTFPLFGSSAPKSGYEPGKRDWMKEISSDPLGFFLTGTDGLSQKREEGILSDYARQTAEANAQKRQREREEIVQLLGPHAGIAYDQNPAEFGKMVAQRYGTNLMSQGQTLDRGIDVPGSRYTADVFGNNEGVLYQQSGDGTVKQTKLQQSDDDANNAAKTAEDIRNNNMTNSRGLAEIGVSRDRLAFDRDEAERKAVNGDPEFTAAHNARIYSDSMDAADAAMKNQGRLDTIARAALQFVENSKNYNSQGEGWWNDLGQALSMDTTGLKQLTDTIAPLIREPGSGGNSDADVNMFKSSVVSINNTKQANVNFANGAQALAGRNKEFVTYLSDAIDPNDPKSRQNANKIWLAYTEENPLYDPKTGELKSPPKFKDWLDIKTGRAVAPVTTSPMQMRTDRGSETIPAQSWSATTSGSARPGPTAPTAPMGLRGGSGGGGGGQMGLTPAAPRPIQSQQPPPDIDPEDWKYFTPEMKQQYLAGRGQ